ncbi:MAG: DegV family protein [Clostridiales bacterium]|nr:DegV family protein [Clostridiales bacterium]
MGYKIVADSCCDFTKEMRGVNFVHVPLTLQIGDYHILDDDNFDQKDFLKRMAAYPDAAKSACPSPEAWLAAFAGEETDIYVMTITAQLSGTYNSAVQAKKIYEEEHPGEKNIHVFDSQGTSGKETILAAYVKALADAGTPFEEIVRKGEALIPNIELYFCLGDLENMRKNGRLSALQTSVLNALRVKLICRETNGNVVKMTQDISINRAIVKLCDVAVKKAQGRDTSGGSLVVSHCNCPERGQKVVDLMTAKLNFKEVVLLEMGGLNSLYASDGGVIVCHSYSV